MARPQRLATARPPRSIGTVSPGQWVVVPVAGDPFPAMIQVGQVQKPALIDFERRGGVRVTVIKIRCPQIPPGDYEVLAVHAGGSERVSVTII